MIHVCLFFALRCVNEAVGRYHLNSRVESSILDGAVLIISNDFTKNTKRNFFDVNSVFIATVISAVTLIFLFSLVCFKTLLVPVGEMFFFSQTIKTNDCSYLVFSCSKDLSLNRFPSKEFHEEFCIFDDNIGEHMSNLFFPQ